jgi:hypothetical protein
MSSKAQQGKNCHYGGGKRFSKLAKFQQIKIITRIKKTTKSFWRRHKQVMKDKPIKLKSILNSRLVTSCD